MIRQSTLELLKEMRFSAMASELERQLADAEAYREMPFEDRLALLVDAEWNRRQSNKYTRCLHNARFAIPNATVEGIEYYEQDICEQSRRIILKWSKAEVQDD